MYYYIFMRINIIYRRNKMCAIKNEEKTFDVEYINIIRDVLKNEEFKKRKNYRHHGDITVYDHSLKVSYVAYKIAKKLGDLDPVEVAIGGLLHDFYYEPWQENHEKKKRGETHCFVHAFEALKNAKDNFPELLDDVIEDIIEKHMFPLNAALPKYKEAWLITIVDKLVSLEVLKQPEFFERLFEVKEKVQNIESCFSRILKKENI